MDPRLALRRHYSQLHLIHLDPSLEPIVRNNEQNNNPCKQHLIINNLIIYLGFNTTDIP